MSMVMTMIITEMVAMNVACDDSGVGGQDGK